MEKVAKKTDMLKILLTAIIVEAGFNPRKDDNFGEIEDLAKSIATMGQDKPLKVVKVRGEDKYLLTAGHRRLQAIHIANDKFNAGIERVDCIVGDSDEKSRLLTALLDGEGVQKLTNAEMMDGISRLLSLGVKKGEIVNSLGLDKSVAQRYNLVKAAEAPKAVKQMVKDGLISVAKVNDLQRKTNSNKELIEAAEEFVKKGKTTPKKKTSKEVATLEEAVVIALGENPKSASAATLKAVVNKLKSGASADKIAKLLQK